MYDIALGELAKEIGGRLSLGTMPPLAGDLTPIGRIVTDSRCVTQGDVFWGLVGPHHNGADFADEAFARGAEGVVVSGRHIEPWAGRWSMTVEDTGWSLWRLAARLRKRFDGSVVAVTGSVGKTTTRQMIHAVLSRRLTGSASPHNYNNHVGVPLSMLAWDPLDDYAVVELGASHRGEIDSLAGLVRPDIAVITRIGEAHLGGFGSQHAIAESKAELLASLPADGWAVLGGDDPWLRSLAQTSHGNIAWIGRSADCDVMATEVEFQQGRLSFAVDGMDFSVPVWGRHYLTSALAAIAVGRLMDLSLDEIAGALAEFQCLPGRCHVSEQDGITVVDDTYNASPTAVRAALELMRDFESCGRRVVVCGDMLELGEGADEWHRKLGEQVVTVCGADMLFACGEHARTVVTAARDAGMPVGNCIVCRSPQNAAALLKSRLVPGDVLLVKGSRATAMETLIDALKTSTTAAAA